jgi:hypothetical protein
MRGARAPVVFVVFCHRYIVLCAEWRNYRIFQFQLYRFYHTATSGGTGLHKIIVVFKLLLQSPCHSRQTKEGAGGEKKKTSGKRFPKHNPPAQ